MAREHFENEELMREVDLATIEGLRLALQAAEAKYDCLVIQLEALEDPCPDR